MQTNKKKELVRVVRFTLFSASAGLIEFGSFAALSALTAWSYWPRYLIALVLSVAFRKQLAAKLGGEVQLNYDNKLDEKASGTRVLIGQT